MPSQTSLVEVRRVAGFDDLKVLLTIGVIVVHAAITYGAPGSWYYIDRPGDPEWRGPLLLPLVVGALFAMGLFFLVAEMLVPGSLRRKGTSRFLADRLRRLGLPLLAFVVVVSPLIELAVARVVDGTSPSVAAYLAEVADLATGPMWFLGSLLIFSSLAVLVPGLARPRGQGGASEPPRRDPLPGSVVVVAVACVAVATFVLRLWFPLDSEQVLNLHVWQWGQCLSLFLLGVVAARRGWLDEPLRSVMRRRLRVAVGVAAVVVVVHLSTADEERLLGGANVDAAVVAVVEGVVAVCLSVLAVDLAQRRLGRQSRVMLWAGRRAYGAFVLQAPVLVMLALALRPSGLNAGAAFVLVAVSAVVLSFVGADLLLRVPGVPRVL